MFGSVPDINNSMGPFVVTTSHRPTPEQVALAYELAEELSTTFIPRNDKSVQDLLISAGCTGLLVVSATRISFLSGSSEFFFHPSLAGLRIKEINDGKNDQMIQAMSLGPGDSLLDCTLGLGTDAIVASYVAGDGGRVTGLESSSVIATIVRRGLKSYQTMEEDLTEAMQRIEVVKTNHKEYLASLPPQSYDVVYFDPMFRVPRRNSPSIDALRRIANTDPVDLETIDLALQVCKRRVVMKERRWSEEFSRLGFTEFYGGKYAPVIYGVIEQVGLR
ncbi:MAG: class I SAM-dependent methyltransferase [Pelotomaculum sp.]